MTLYFIDFLLPYANFEKIIIFYKKERFTSEYELYCQDIAAGKIKNADNMIYTFQSCSSLTGTVEIHVNPTTCDGCFNNTSKSIVLTGTSTMLNELAKTGLNVTVK